MIKESKNNKLGLVSSSSGGYNVLHDTKSGDLTIKVPQPEKSDTPLGLAKASPIFKKVEPKVKASKTDEEKAIKENLEKTESNVLLNPSSEPTTPPTT